MPRSLVSSYTQVAQPRLTQMIPDKPIKIHLLICSERDLTEAFSA